MEAVGPDARRSAIDGGHRGVASPPDDRLRRRGLHARRGGHPPALLHEPRRSGLRPGQPARGGQGGPVRPLLPQLQEPAPPVPRRVRRRPRHHRATPPSTPPSACAGPRSSTTGCSSSTATTRWPSSAASTWPASRRRTCSPRCSSGAGSWPTSSSPPGTSPTTPASAAATATTATPRCWAPASASATSATWTGCSTPTPSWCPLMADFYRDQFPKDPADSDFVYRQAIRAKAFDAVRGVLPGRLPVQRRHLRHRPGLRGAAAAHAVAPAARVPGLRRPHAQRAAQGHPELPEAGRPRRPGRGLEHLPGVHPRPRWRRSPAACSRTASRPTPGPAVTLLDWDPDGEVKLVAAMLYSHTHVSEAVLEQRVRAMTVDERLAVIQAYVGDRANRRHKPGRALERLTYRFDVLADYGAFRDLQRHRMLSIEWQQLSPRHGFTRPEAVDLAGCGARFDEAMERSSGLHDALVERFPAQAAYAVSLAYKVRFYLHLNAREAMHLLELRTDAAGPPRLPRGRPGDAPPHRRAGRPPRRGRGHALRRPLARAQPRAPRRRTSGRSPPPEPLSETLGCWHGWCVGRHVTFIEGGGTTGSSHLAPGRHQVVRHAHGPEGHHLRRAPREDHRRHGPVRAPASPSSSRTSSASSAPTTGRSGWRARRPSRWASATSTGCAASSASCSRTAPCSAP